VFGRLDISSRRELARALPDAAMWHQLQRTRVGLSAVVVLCRNSGIGKTAVLGFVAEQANGYRVARAVGV
jgi:hypothetical protein